MNTTGIDMAAAIPVGATITRVYFCEPGYYTVARSHDNPDWEDGEYATHRDALANAIEAKKTALDAARDNLLPDHITIDVRWTMTFPDGGGTDIVAERFSYESLLHAQNHLDRIDGSRATPVFR